MKKIHQHWAAFFIILLITPLLSACQRSTAINCASQEDFCVGLVSQMGKVTDHGLNQMAWDGVKKAELKLGVYGKYIETVDSRDYEKNIAIFAKANYDLIITVGYDQHETTLAAAIQYPQINFIGVDQPLETDKSLPTNLTGLSFGEDQMGFLAGVLAAQMTKAKKVGAVCGPDFLPTAWRYCEGFKVGVGYVNDPPTPEPTSTRTPRPTKTSTPTPVTIITAIAAETVTPPGGIFITPTPSATKRITRVTPIPNSTDEEEPIPDEECDPDIDDCEPIDECDPTFEDCDLPPDECDPEIDECEAEEDPTEDPNATEEPDSTEEPAAYVPIDNQRAIKAHPQDEFPTETPDPNIFSEETPNAVSTSDVPQTPTVEAIVMYHNDIGFKESLVDPKWDAESADTLITGGVDVIFGADSYEENGAISAAARRYKYAIGVNTDQYYTIHNAQGMLLSSIVKQVDEGVFNLIKMTRDGNFPGGNFQGTVGYAPFHDLSDRVPGPLRQILTEFEQGVADGSIEIDVLPSKPSETSAPTSEPTPETPEEPTDEEPIDEEPTPETSP